MGVWLRDATGTTVAYVSAAAELGEVGRYADGLDALLLDGTFFSSDELSRPGLSKSRAEDMAHLPIGDPGGSLEHGSPRTRRRIYTHLKAQTRLVGALPERRAVEDAGWGSRGTGWTWTPPLSKRSIARSASAPREVSFLRSYDPVVVT